jgi:hypothetical protein
MAISEMSTCIPTVSIYGVIVQRLFVNLISRLPGGFVWKFIFKANAVTYVWSINLAAFSGVSRWNHYSYSPSG